MAQNIGILAQGGTIHVGTVNVGGTEPKPPATPAPKIILVLAASPAGEDLVRVDKEMAAIQDALRGSQQRDRFAVVTRPAATLDRLQDALVDLRPAIVHFCGHGSGTDLVFENSQQIAYFFSKKKGKLALESVAETDYVSYRPLADLFGAFADALELVVLNACETAELAELSVAHIPYAVGMAGAVRDDLALAFAKGFYRALFGGMTVEKSFDLGKVAIALVDDGQRDLPVLKVNPNPPSRPVGNSGAGEAPPSVRQRQIDALSEELSALVDQWLTAEEGQRVRLQRAIDQKQAQMDALQQRS